MITIHKLRIYKKYNGDGDAFVSMGKTKEKKIMTYTDWKILDDSLQDIGLIKKKLTSEDYAKNVINRINEMCDYDKKVIDELWKMG